MKYDVIAERSVEYGTIHHPSEAIPIIRKLIKPRASKEHFIVITLDGLHQPISARIVSVGTVNKSLAHPREVFRAAILDNAQAVMVAHNHPAGTLEPSQEDLNITKALQNAGEILGVKVLDHIIVTKDSFYSFSEGGLM